MVPALRTLRLAGLVGTTLLVPLSQCRAVEDAVHPLQIVSAPNLDVETTGNISPATQTGLIGSQNEADLGLVRNAIEAYRRGRLAEGDGYAASLDDRAARALLEWVAIRFNAGSIRFERLTGFLAENPNFPGTTAFRRRAEEALIAEKRDLATIRSFFYAQRPVSPVGRVALARVLKADGSADEARALIRETWRADHLGVAIEKIVLDEFGDWLGADDHRLRAERYLFKENVEAGMRNAARVSGDYVALARARMAAARKGGNAKALIAAVPKGEQKQPSFAFAQAQLARRESKPVEAAKFMEGVPRDPKLLGNGDDWWTERRLIARQLLDQGKAKEAYAVVAGHGAESTADRIEAEWHAGWIAMRFLDDAARALPHFTAATEIAETPISVARAAYWQGRAAEALGREIDANEAYGRAAAQPVAYYGQLARARIGLPDLPVRRAVAAPLDHLPGQRAVRLLYRIGARDLAGVLLIDLAQRLHTIEALEALAGIAAKERDARVLLAIGKQALQRGFPLDGAAFPTFGVPDFPVLGDPVERPMVHAIARQESAFDPAAVSPAGARGLMQMMPATARETARRAKMPYDLGRLTADPRYCAQLGAAHLADLLKDWRGSYILTFAAYNAGSGNVRKWIEAYGDPRKPEIDAVDWVERIPFSETRNYVQRVMENLQVYRQRLDQRVAYLIDADMKRGGSARD